MVQAAADDQQPALAITDLSNLFGAIKFYKAARGKGVQPILGAEIFLEGLGADPLALSRVMVLVQSSQGYLNLSELLARAWTQNMVKTNAVVKLSWLQELSDGLILLSGAQAGPVGQALVQGDASRAAEIALQLASIFTHRFYLEIQRAGRPEDNAHVVAAVALELASGGHASSSVFETRRLRIARSTRVHFRRRNFGQPTSCSKVHWRSVLQNGR